MSRRLISSLLPGASNVTRCSELILEAVQAILAKELRETVADERQGLEVIRRHYPQDLAAEPQVLTREDVRLLTTGNALTQHLHAENGENNPMPFTPRFRHLLFCALELVPLANQPRRVMGSGACRGLLLLLADYQGIRFDCREISIGLIRLFVGLGC